MPLTALEILTVMFSWALTSPVRGKERGICCLPTIVAAINPGHRLCAENSRRKLHNAQFIAAFIAGIVDDTVFAFCNPHFINRAVKIRCFGFIAVSVAVMPVFSLFLFLLILSSIFGCMVMPRMLISGFCMFIA